MKLLKKIKGVIRIDVIMLTTNKIQGCYWGLALGDALGMPIEFKLIEKIREIYGEGGIQNLEENCHIIKYHSLYF